MNNFTYASSEFFYLFLLLPLLLLWYIFRLPKSHSAVSISGFQGFQSYKPSLKQRFRHVLLILRLATFALLIVALARPQLNSTTQTVNTEGIDIILAMDISPSMLAEDLKPNRIEAAKKLALEFIDGRPNDRFGLVVFAGESFTQCPLTTDHSVIKNMFGSIKSGMISDGTALGEGLATAVNRIKQSKAKSRIIVLLTDGVNNSGALAPLTAGEIAKAFNVKVYCIGVGTQGTAPYPVQTPYGVRYQNVPVEIDEAVMSQIAEMTNAKYFRATNNKKLQNIYKEIDQLEKTKIEVKEYRKHSEEFLPFAVAAAIIFLIEYLLRYTYFKTFP